MAHSNKIFDRQLVARRRLRALEGENYPDFLDQLIGRELVSRLDLIERKFQNCLVLGQPSRRFLQELARSPKLSNLIAWRCGQAGCGDVVFDSEWLPFKDDSLDCIIAPPGLESVNDLPGTLIQINRALKPDGLFLGAMYGGLTLVELRHAWLLADEEYSGGASPRVAPFIDVRQAGNLLQRAGLALPVADSDVLCVRYDNGKTLMAEIKAMGFSNALLRRSGKPVTRKLLALAEQYYGKEFSDPDGRVRATVEINYLTAWSPHDSQQKPLKPGSAKHHFSEILVESKKTD